MHYASLKKLQSINLPHVQNDDCLRGEDLDSLTSSLEACEEWCAGMADCGGFVRLGPSCYFKETRCKDNIVAATYAGTVLYLKQLR